MMRAAIGATLGENPWRVQVSAQPPTWSRADDEQFDAGRPERADEARILFLVPLPLNVGVLRRDEPPRALPLDAGPGAGRGEARDEDLRPHPRPGRTGVAGSD